MGWLSKQLNKRRENDVKQINSFCQELAFVE